MLHYAIATNPIDLNSSTTIGWFRTRLPFDGELVGAIAICDPAVAGDMVFDFWIGGPNAGAGGMNATTTILSGQTLGQHTGFTLPGSKGDMLSIDGPYTADGDPFGTTIAAGRLTVIFVLDDGVEAGGGGGAPINWRGVWGSGTGYVAGDGIVYNGSSYVALTASTNVAPNSDPAKWQLIAAKGDAGAAGAPGAAGAAGQGFTWRGAWSGATAYVAYDTVSYNGSSYVAIAGSTNVAPGTDATKWALLAQKGADGSGGSGGATLPTEFISGFDFKRSGGTFDEDIEVGPGSAYVPGAGAGEVVTLNAAVVRVPGSTQTGWMYIYLFKNGSGDGDIEISTTAPTYYRGDAQHKTGDNTRRFVGAYYRDGTIGVHNFHVHHQGSRGTIIWRRTLYSAPWLLLNGANVLGTDTQVTPTIPSSSNNLLPPFCAMLHLIARLTVNANSRSFFGLSQLPNDVGDGNPWGAEVLLENDNQSGAAVEKMIPCEIRLDRGVQSFYYYIQQFSGGGPLFTLHLRGVTYRR